MDFHPGDHRWGVSNKVLTCIVTSQSSERRILKAPVRADRAVNQRMNVDGDSKSVLETNNQYTPDFDHQYSCGSATVP